MIVIKDRKITQDEADNLMVGISQDLIAFYKLMEEAIFETMKKADKEGWTAERLIFEVEKLFDDEGDNKTVLNIEKSLNVSSVNKSKNKLQGSLDFQGLKISIENRKGSIREGMDSNGHKWKVKMNYPYGYIKLTEGTDGDHVDVYIGDNKMSDRVYIIHQNNPDTGNYDEDKIMLGFDTAEEARAGYLSQYDRPGFFGSMEITTMEKFKELLKNKKGKKLSLINKSLLDSLNIIEKLKRSLE
jgi:hypothetical protein